MKKVFGAILGLGIVLILVERMRQLNQKLEGEISQFNEVQLRLENKTEQMRYYARDGAFWFHSSQVWQSFEALSEQIRLPGSSANQTWDGALRLRIEELKDALEQMEGSAKWHGCQSSWAEALGEVTDLGLYREKKTKAAMKVTLATIHECLLHMDGVAEVRHNELGLVEI